ncbi:MAG: aldo/keto reductase [Victivallales bacterium]|nr:aldo/keto reductase [Victivallales bacterium]
MDRVTLGRTGLNVCKNGFGALPIQRISCDEAAKLIVKAYQNGIDMFDTANFYTDSEKKIGMAMSQMKRDKIVITTKTGAATPEVFWQHLDNSLRMMHIDYIDIYQFHNPKTCPLPNDGSGLYECMQDAQKQGKIRFIGLTNHRLDTAMTCIESGLYDSLQFPFNYLSGEPEKQLVERCKKANMGFIAMKALSGGLIKNSRAAYAYLRQFPSVLPIWGVQRESELDEFISYNDNPPSMDAELQSVIDADRKELTGEFCRGCGYCMPCPAGIEINNCARMSLLLRRSPSAGHLSPAGQAKMAKIKECKHCGKCKSKCPYGLDTPALLQRNLEDYEQFLAEYKKTHPDF